MNYRKNIFSALSFLLFVLTNLSCRFHPNDFHLTPSSSLRNWNPKGSRWVLFADKFKIGFTLFLRKQDYITKFREVTVILIWPVNWTKFHLI